MYTGIAPFKYDEACRLEHDAGTIFYWVLFPEKYSERYTRGEGNQTTVEIVVQWKDAADFKKYAMGFTTGVRGEDVFRRRLPLACPWASNQYLAEMVAVSAGNFAADEGGPATRFELDPVFDNWPKCGYVSYLCTFVSLNYQLLPNDQIESKIGFIGTGVIPELFRYVRKTERTLPKERRVPSATFETDDGVNTKIPEVGFFAVYEKEYVYTLIEVPYDLIPRAEMDARLVKVNSLTFDGMAPETVLFKGLTGELQPYVGPGGELYCDLPYLMGYRPDGWNKAPVGFNSSGGPNYIRIKQTGAPTGTKPPYASTTFVELFKPRA